MLSGEELQEGVGKRLESDWISENFQFGLIHEVGEEHHIEDFQVVIKVFVDTIMNKNQNKLKNKYKNSSLRNQNNFLSKKNFFSSHCSIAPFATYKFYLMPKAR